MTLDPPARTVAILGHTSALGGAELVLCRLLPALDRTRFNPVVVLFEAGPLADRLTFDGERVVLAALDERVARANRDRLVSAGPTAAASVWRTLLFMIKLRSTLKSLDLDLVHTNTLKSHVLGGLAARSLGLPVVFYVHDRLTADYLPSRVAALMRVLVRRLPQHVLANSAATAQTLAPLPDGRWSVAYPGVPIAADMPTPTSSTTAPVIGMVGRISPTKGQDVFIAAAATLAARHPEARFVIAGSALFGEDAYEARVRGEVAALGLSDRLRFLGFVSDVPALLATLDVLVHASPTPEPFGQVIVEAMLAGVPVVATDAGGVAEIVTFQGQQLGELVPPGDPDALADAISAVLADPDAADRRRLAARESARRRFSVEVMARAVQSGWQSACDRRPRPGRRGRSRRAG